MFEKNLFFNYLNPIHLKLKQLSEFSSKVFKYKSFVKPSQ